MFNFVQIMCYERCSHAKNAPFLNITKSLFKIKEDINDVLSIIKSFERCDPERTILKLEKGFQKKPIVAFTNSTVFILDFNI